MLLTLTTTHRPATDLGYLLAKNPARCQTFEMAFGKAHVFYPAAEADRCTAALLLDLDPVGLVRGRARGPGGEAGALAQYVNDRPYVASSFLSVAIARILGSALRGESKGRQNLADTPIPLEAALSAVPCRGGEALLTRLFEPLGYAIDARRLALDVRFPEWGESPYFALRIAATTRLRDLLTHLYVMLPVLDDEKHYWVGDDEVDKLLKRGEEWLPRHPERELIVRRYLRHQRRLVRDTLARLVSDEDPDPQRTEEERGRDEAALEAPLNLNDQRIGAVVAALRQAGARRVIDVGCGEGRLVQELLRDRAFEKIAGMDVSWRALEMARDRLDLDRLPPAVHERVELFQGALTYRDRRLAGYDAACVVEVIEHLDPARLPPFERSVFEFARPGTVVVTTPNAEYNVRFANLAAGKFRHRDHRFEWTRAELQAWAQAVAARFRYTVRFLPVGPDDAEVGSPTQMALFTVASSGAAPRSAPA